MCATLDASQNSQQPEMAGKLVFRSIRDQKMKGSITLAACLDSLATERLASEFAPQRGHPLTVHAGEVSFVGALALQLLLATYRQWQADEKLFEITGPSDAFLDGIALLGGDPAMLGLGGPVGVTQ